MSDSGRWVFYTTLCPLTMTSTNQEAAYFIEFSFDAHHIRGDRSEVIECLLVTDVSRAQDLADLSWNL